MGCALIALAFAFALAGCGQAPSATPTASPAAWVLAPTWTSAPTATPTAPPTVTPSPTFTPAPTVTATPTPDMVSRILFVSNQDGGPAIYSIDVDSADVLKLTLGEDAETAPAFSPDGERIAYVSMLWGDPDIFVRDVGDASGDSVVQLTRHAAADEWPAWSPDGRYVLFASDRGAADHFNLYTVPVACGRSGAASLNGAMDCEAEVMQVTDGPDVADIYPAWSPGAQIVFASDRAGAGDFDLYTVLPDSDPAHLTGSPRADWFPSWSPDGSMVAFASGWPATAVFQLYVARHDGTHVRQLTGVPDVLNSFPVWSPEGDALAYVSTVDGARDIYIIDVASGASRRLTEDGQVVMVGDWARVLR